jgi:class 3 adenylate cyclase/tetratricopeptide (TPR) repeat protein
MTWLAEEPDARSRIVDGTLVFADVSGFTALSERLARQGRVGAEILADTISACFSRLLAAAYSNGGSLLKFGGDALLLLFTGPDHCRRACNAAAGMRRELRSLGPNDGAGGRTRLRMSQGVHTGDLHLFLVGGSSRELVVAGPTATTVVEMEGLADKGEIVVSDAVAAQLARSSVGAAKGAGYLLRREPAGLLASAGDSGPAGDAATLALGLPDWMRRQAAAQVQEPQHRNITVAFVKFRGLDGLLAAHGPSVVAAELERLVADVQNAAERHEVFLLGTDVDKDGGKLLVVGGAPRATGGEEEAVLCVAREIVDVDRLLTVQVGVNSGSAFAGDIGPSYRRTFTVMGDTVNLAARVMAHARAGTVLATEPVLARSRVLFRATSVEPFQVKGKSAPVTAVEVGAPRERVQVDPSLLPLVGRETELAELQAAWDRAVAGHGGVLVVGGEPGVGKSRLVAEARSRIDARQLAVVCDQYAANTPYWAARQLLRQALGCTADDDAAVHAALVTAFSGPAAGLAPWAPLVGLVAGVDLPMTPEVADLDDRFRRARLEYAVIALLTALLPEPTLFAIEDAHWVDEASAHLLASAVPHVGSSRWLVFASRREQARGFHPPEGGNVRVLELQPLAVTATTALAEVLAEDSGSLDPAVLDTLVARSGGNPLFLAELMAGARRSGTDELPESLEGLILARIDALAPDKHMLLRRLAVLGSTFSIDLARAVLGELVPAAGDVGWRRLEEFVSIDGDTLTFRHGLLMDGAYNSLPFRVRETLHATVGDTIERSAGASAAEHAEVLSLHFFKAKRYPKAWRYSHLAAERSVALYANADAATFYERAIESARRIGQGECDELLALLECLGDVRRRMGEPTAAAAAFAQARRLVADDPIVRARLLFKQAGVRQHEGSHAQALRWLHRADALVKELDSGPATEQRARIAVARASIAKDRNRGTEVVRWCEIAIREAVRIGDKAIQAHASFLLDHAYVTLGRPELATNSVRALALYEEIGDLWGQGTVCNNLGGHAYWAGRWEEAAALYERALAAFTRIGDVHSVAAALVNLGEIRSDQGRIDEADELFRQSLQIWQRAGDRASVAFVISNIGRLATRREDFAVAREQLLEARDLADRVSLPADVLEADLRLVECSCHAGEAAQTLVAGSALTPRVERGSIQAAMLHRLLGFASLMLGEVESARAAFVESLGHADLADAPFERGSTLRGLAYCDAADGYDPMPRLTEAEAVLTRLGVVAVDEPMGLTMADPTVRLPIPAQPSRQRVQSLPS